MAAKKSPKVKGTSPVRRSTRRRRPTSKGWSNHDREAQVSSVMIGPIVSVVTGRIFPLEEEV